MFVLTSAEYPGRSSAADLSVSVYRPGRRVAKKFAHSAICVFGQYSLLFVLLGCGGPAFDTPPARPDTPVFVVPLEYKPDDGVVLDDSRRIQSSEFGVHITGEEIASNVEGFEAVTYGYENDIRLIIFAYSPSRPPSYYSNPDQARAFREEIWFMRGSFENACIGERPDPYTGYVRYYKSCIDDQSGGLSFWLLDQIPSPEVEAPMSNDFIVGNCWDMLPEIRQGSRRDDFPEDLDEYIGCIESGQIGDLLMYQYRLRGPNIAVREGVKEYITGLIQNWRQG